MSMLLKIGIFLIITYLIPYLIGLLFTTICKKSPYSFSKNMLFGYMFIWGLLQITVIPAIYLRFKLNVYSFLIYGILLALAVISIIVNRNTFKSILLDKITWLRSKPWFQLFVILLILGQTVYFALANCVDFDDAFYVATAETALETNTLMEVDPYTGALYSILPSRYVLSPFPLFIALISKVLNIRAATTAHTLLPLTLIPLAYMTWQLIGDKLYANNRTKSTIFTFFVFCLLTFSGYSVYTQGMFMLVRIWQGKAVLTAIIIPFIFYQCLCIIREECSFYSWILLFFTMLTSCFVSSMGIMLGAIALGITAFTDAIIHRSLRKWKNIIICCLPNIIFSIIYIIIR